MREEARQRAGAAASLTAADDTAAAEAAGRRVTVLLCAAILPPTLIVAVVSGVVAGLALGAVVGLIVSVALGAAVGLSILRGVSARCHSGIPIALGGSPVDAGRHARLVNVAEGLCAGAGVRLPELRVLDSDGLNLAVAGRRQSAATLVVTSALLGRLSRIELEGILAVAVVALRRGVADVGTVVAATGVGAPPLLDADLEVVLDAAAVRLTRYPPGLQAALEACERYGTAVAGFPSRAAALWLLEPGVDTGDPRSGAAVPTRRDLARSGHRMTLPRRSPRRPLRERIDVLSEL